MAPKGSGTPQRSNLTLGGTDSTWRSEDAAVPRRRGGLAVMPARRSSESVSQEWDLASAVGPREAAARVTTLGQFRVLLRAPAASPTDGTPGDSSGGRAVVVWSTAQARQLLKCLIASPGYQRARDELIELLWAEQDVERARAALSHALTHLRRTLDPGRSAYSGSAFIGSNRDTVWLVVASPDAPDGGEEIAAGLWLDVAHFERLAHTALAIFERAMQEPTGDSDGREGSGGCAGYGGYGVRLAERALALYGGPFLPTDLFADWAGAMRDRVLRVWVTLVRRLAAYHVATGNFEHASLLFGDLVDAMPDNEDAVARLMLLHTAMNQRALALRLYQTLCTQLLGTLDAQPTPVLQQLAQTIRSGTLADDPLTVLRQLP
jgi:DNA-binding SARP family transcriptional activator